MIGAHGAANGALSGIVVYARGVLWTIFEPHCSLRQREQRPNCSCCVAEAEILK
jgi:hypothetical protein